MLGFKNVKAYVLGEGVIKTNIGIENGVIAYIGDDPNVITKELPFAEGQIVLPGFIDQHVHGAGGFDVMDSPCTLRKISTTLAKEGTTSYLATTMTASADKLSNTLSQIKNYLINQTSNASEVIGVHLEGPFISSIYAGAQPREHVKTPSVELFDELNFCSGNNIKIVTLAPEKDNADELIEHLCSLQIVASAGHTDAGYEQMLKSYMLGLTGVTHTFNAQKTFHHRDIGCVGSALLLENLTTEVIADLIHVSAPAIKLLTKNKLKDKVVLVTDSIRAKGTCEGESELGGQKVFVKNGIATLSNGKLAGSTLKMNEGIKNLVLECDVPFTEAVDFATINPATNLKIDKNYGSIALNKYADFVVINGEFEVLLTVKKGNVIYKA